jgi:ADP-ribose pyrophosphatase YjhB (NUDIX family)
VRHPDKPELGTLWCTPGGGIDDGEQAAVAAARELATTAETVVPYGLVPLLTGLLAGDRPAEPVQLPWHH